MTLTAPEEIRDRVEMDVQEAGRRLEAAQRAYNEAYRAYQEAPAGEACDYAREAWRLAWRALNDVEIEVGVPGASRHFV